MSASAGFGYVKQKKWMHSSTMHPLLVAGRGCIQKCRQRVSFLYLTRCGITESWPSRRILSFS
jgi:hypothetical protein